MTSPTQKSSNVAIRPKSHQSSSVSQSDNVVSESDATFFAALRDSLPDTLSTRVVFKTVTPNNKTSAVDTAIDSVKDEMTHSMSKPGNITVVGRRNNRVDHTLDIDSTYSDEVGLDARGVLGAVAQALVRTKHRTVGNVLVLQAASRHD